MNVKKMLIDELVKAGYSMKGKNKVWSFLERDLLYLTKDLAEGYLKLRNHPRYEELIMNIEFDLLKKNAEFIKKELMDKSFNLVDLGCGDGKKAKFILEVLNGNKIRFCPVNVNPYLVELVLKNIRKTNNTNIEEYKPITARLSETEQVLAEVRNSKFQKNVILLLGSIIASYEINDYLFNLSRNMLPGDVLIIGNGIRTGERLDNLNNYKHKAFSGWFNELMKELGFKEDEVEYDARFTDGRVEMFYRIKKDKAITEDKKKIEFKQGDEIVVASLYKYFENELEEFCKKYFRKVSLFKDSKEEYAVVICIK